MTSVKKNFFYSSILTTAGYIFPLITYPYVSRVLGVEKIGLCNFIDSIVSYFILFSMMGITVTGIREVAKYKNDSTQLNKAFSSLFALNLITTILSISALLLSGIFIPKFRAEFDLICFGTLKILFNFLLIEWLFKGLEDFKYITVRTIIARLIFIVLIFLFVRVQDNYTIYYFLLCSITIINGCCNCWYSRKFITLSFKDLNIKQYLKPFIILGINGFLVSMYTTFNVAYLGFVSSDTEVGFYTTATKLYAIILSLYTAFTGVMLPRMSSLLTEHNTKEFTRLLNKSISLLIGCSIPFIIFVEFYASQIIYLIAGNGFEGAILPMKIIMPLVFVIGYEQILVIQTLMPLHKDSAIFLNSIIGAGLGILLNIIIVPHFFALGSSIVWVSCEVVILILSQIIVTRTIKVNFPYKKIINTIALYIPVSIIFYILLLAFKGIWGMIIGMMTLFIYFLFIHSIVLKDDIGKYILRIFK